MAPNATDWKARWTALADERPDLEAYVAERLSLDTARPNRWSDNEARRAMERALAYAEPGDENGERWRDVVLRRQRPGNATVNLPRMSTPHGSKAFDWGRVNPGALDLAASVLTAYGVDGADDEDLQERFAAKVLAELPRTGEARLTRAGVREWADAPETETRAADEPQDADGGEPAWTLSMTPEEYLRRYPDGPNADAARRLAAAGGE